MTQAGPVILILGSGPNAPRSKGWPKAWFDRIAVMNNAWRLRDDWDMLVFPEDFPPENRPQPPGRGQSWIEADAFVPAQNAYGGFIFAGATMAYTTAYWALYALRPRVMAFMGCDMVYPKTGPTHFYGTGAPDPLRDDISLRDLGAKSARLGVLAARQGCACVNLSEDPSSLLFPRAAPDGLRDVAAAGYVPEERIAGLEAREAALGYDTPDGRYENDPDRRDMAALADLDADWRALWADMMPQSGEG